MGNNLGYFIMISNQIQEESAVNMHCIRHLSAYMSHKVKFLVEVENFTNQPPYWVNNRFVKHKKYTKNIN